MRLTQRQREMVESNHLIVAPCQFQQKAALSPFTTISNSLKEPKDQSIDTDLSLASLLVSLWVR